METRASLPPTWPPEYPPHRPVSGAEAAELDRRATAEHGLPSLVLMEHASRGVAGVAARLAPLAGTILVCCGPGNNGGDGYGCARFLRSWGRSVEILRLSRDFPYSGDAALQVALAGAAVDGWSDPSHLDAHLARDPALIVDALFGVNLARPIADPFLSWIRAINACPVPTLSIDIPSGMNTDDGRGMPECVRADVTATMAAPKLGFASGAAGQQAAGRVVELDIGLPLALHEPLQADGF